jgi:hypothetical protein
MDLLSNSRREGDDVVVQRLLEFPLPGDQSAQVFLPGIAAGFDAAEIGGRDDRISGRE